MDSLETFLPYIQITLSVLLIVAILMQRSDAGLGGAFGGGDASSANFYTKRGAEKILFNATIVIAILFALSSFANLLV
ncbi:MAG: preprotein translocase subunit SecG [Patescibacteria group bacterium]